VRSRFNTAYRPARLGRRSRDRRQKGGQQHRNAKRDDANGTHGELGAHRVAGVGELIDEKHAGPAPQIQSARPFQTMMFGRACASDRRPTGFRAGAEREPDEQHRFNATCRCRASSTADQRRSRRRVRSAIGRSDEWGTEPACPFEATGIARRSPRSPRQGTLAKVQWARTDEVSPRK